MLFQTGWLYIICFAEPEIPASFLQYQGYATMIRLNISFPSLSLLRNVNVEVALPGGLSAPTYPCRCLWALHCAMQDGNFFFESLGMGEMADRLQTAIVAPSLENGYFVNSSYENQGDFLQELISTLTELLPLSREKNNNSVLGISMGAFGAARWALQSDAFCSVIAISGVFDCHIPVDKRISEDRKQKALHVALNKTMRSRLLDENGKTAGEADLKQMLAKRKSPFPMINLFCGAQDYISLPQTMAMRKECLEFGCPVKLAISPGSHDLRYWRSIVETAASDFFRAPDSEEACI